MGMFKPASRTKCKLRAAIVGPSGAGKTFTAQRLAFALGKRVCVIATEPGAAEKYAGLAPDGIPWQFDIVTLDDYSPSSYRSAILAAGQERYDVCIVDSLSHEWEGTGGALELVDKQAANGKGNKFTEGWGKVTPMHRALFEAIVRSPCHVIATVRTKTEYALEKNEYGKSVPVKLGMKPVQREGVEYEFDVFARMDLTHTMVIEKTRCPNIDSLTVVKPGASAFQPLVDWLNEGLDPPAGYYTASEADLAASQAAREAAATQAKQAEPPKPRRTAADIRAEKSAKEQAEIDRLKAEAETKVAEAQAVGNQLAATAKGATREALDMLPGGPEREKAAKAPAMAQRQQALEAVGLCKELGLSESQIRTAIFAKAAERYGHPVTRFTELTKDDCHTVIEKLKASLAARKLQREPGEEGDPTDTSPTISTDDIPF